MLPEFTLGLLVIIGLIVLIVLAVLRLAKRRPHEPLIGRLLV